MKPRGEAECKHVALTFIGVEGGVPRALWVHSLLANLKQKSRNESVGRETQVPPVVSALGHPGLSRRGDSMGGGPGSSSSSVCSTRMSLK